MNRLSNMLTATLRVSMALGLALTAVACASDSAPEGDFGSVALALDEEPATLPPEPQAANMCVPVSIGGGADLCKPHKFWAKRADQTCGDLGLQVAKLELHKRCAKTRFIGADVLCCNAEAQECVIDMVGSPKACKSAGAWEAIAAKECMDQGMSLTQIKAGVDCAPGQFRYARYECCGVAMTCDEGDSWDEGLNACCPDATWIADCWCPEGWSYFSDEVHDENGCLLGIGCGCEPPNCDDGMPVFCDVDSVECPDGLVSAAQNGCYECVDPLTCAAPPQGGCLSDAQCDGGQVCQWVTPCAGCAADDGECEPCYGTCVDPDPEGCYGDQDCPAGTTCNASEVCLPPPGCDPGNACPAVCYGWCVGDDGCGEDESWDAALGACCPNSIYIPSCAMCPNGAFPEIVEVYNADGCLEGYTCSCEGANCDDGGPVMCDMEPPECPDGL
ncbi:MAG: hypothetical protein QF464_05455, partial [Myxococcota bacterium]|nr:hypothetical protein [Myxococcota bacterium]